MSISVLESPITALNATMSNGALILKATSIVLNTTVLQAALGTACANPFINNYFGPACSNSAVREWFNATCKYDIVVSTVARLLDDVAFEDMATSFTNKSLIEEAGLAYNGMTALEPVEMAALQLLWLVSLGAPAPSLVVFGIVVTILVPTTLRYIRRRIIAVLPSFEDVHLFVLTVTVFVNLLLWGFGAGLWVATRSFALVHEAESGFATSAFTLVHEVGQGLAMSAFALAIRGWKWFLIAVAIGSIHFAIYCSIAFPWPTIRFTWTGFIITIPKLRLHYRFGLVITKLRRPARRLDTQQLV